MAHCEHQRVTNTCSICKPESVYNQYRYKAEEQRHLPFLLTLDEFTKIVQQPCVFCGEEVKPRGVDRRNNFIGYVVSNCQAACGECNHLRRRLCCC